MGTQTVTEMSTIVPPALRLDRGVRLAVAVDVLFQLFWAQLRQIRKEPVRVDDNATMYEKPETYQEYQTL